MLGFELRDSLSHTSQIFDMLNKHKYLPTTTSLADILKTKWSQKKKILERSEMIGDFL